MKYLIIGGNGFIGSHFCKKLNVNDYDIYDIDDPNGKPEEEVIRGRKEGLNKSINKINENKIYDYLVHFGSYAGIRDRSNHDEFYDNNCLEYINLLNKAKFRKLIYISSSSVLGNIRTAYSISKEIAEELTRTYRDHLIIRPFTVYGEYGRPEMLITKCINGEDIFVNGDPNRIYREFTYVGDLVSNIMDLKDLFGTYNIRGKNKYTIKDILDIFGNKYTIGDASKYDFTSQKKDHAKDVYCETTIEEFKYKLKKNSEVNREVF